MPETVIFNVDGDLAEVKREIKSKLSYPVVFKPADGVSCGGLSIVKEDSQIEAAIAENKSSLISKKLS